MKPFLSIFALVASIHAFYMGTLQKLAANLSARSMMHRQKGVTALEYVLIIAVIVIVIIGAVSSIDFGTKVTGVMTSVGNSLS